MGLASVYPGVSDSNLPLVFSWLCCYLCSFPRERRSRTLERIVLSFAFSIIIVPLIGFVLNFTPWGVQLLSCLISISFFIILMAIVAMYRRHQLSPQVQYMPFLELELSSFKQLPAQDKMMALMWCWQLLSQQHPVLTLLPLHKGVRGILNFIF